MTETDQTTDLLGRETTADERELLSLYRRLQTLATNTELPPCALMNVRQALVLLWNACTDLDLVLEEPGSD